MPGPAATPYGGWSLGNFKNKYLGALARGEGDADTMDQMYMDRAENFDPASAYKEMAQGAYNQYEQNFDNQSRALTERSVGAGRLNTGFLDEDRRSLRAAGFNTFQDTLAKGALDASGQQANYIGQLGTQANARRGQYLDLLSSAYTDEANRKAQGGWFGKALGGIVGTAAGAFAGGVGSKLAGQLFHSE